MFLMAPSRAFAQNTQDFIIKSFTADYYLSRTSDQSAALKVEEEIVAEFPSYDQNHGILRSIPKTYKDHTLSLKVLSITDQNGQKWGYDDSTQNDNLVLKIGDADKFVHGEQTYKIVYEMRNVISFQDLDEFYWDVNGNEWFQPFDSITARIHLGKELADVLQPEMLCFGGFLGSSDNRCTITKTDSNQDTVVTVQSTQPYISGQTLTFVLGFTKGTFKLGPEIAREELRQRLIIAGIIGSVVIPPLIALAVMTKKWQKYGRDPQSKNTVVPEYIAQKGFNAMSSDYMIHEQLTPKAMSAAIVELAVNHYIVIKEDFKKHFIGSDRQFELELVKDVSGLSIEQKDLVQALFGGSVIGTKVKLNDLKYKLAKDFKKIGESLGTRLYEQGFFRTDPGKVRKLYATWGGGLMIASFVFMMTGFLASIGAGLIVAGLILVIFSSKMPARSTTGVEARNYARGLEQYMKLAEEDRLNFSQGLNTAERVKAGDGTSADKIKLFERLLPYAMLFGLEKQWSKQFADLYKTQPDWYAGNVNAFSAAHLGDSMSSLNSASVASFSAPGSSGGSGFGGGGFSGGGGGGGGGGGW